MITLPSKLKTLKADDCIIVSDLSYFLYFSIESLNIELRNIESNFTDIVVNLLKNFGLEVNTVTLERYKEMQIQNIDIVDMENIVALDKYLFTNFANTLNISRKFTFKDNSIDSFTFTSKTGRTIDKQLNLLSKSFNEICILEDDAVSGKTLEFVINKIQNNNIKIKRIYLFGLSEKASERLRYIPIEIKPVINKLKYLDFTSDLFLHGKYVYSIKENDFYVPNIFFASSRFPYCLIYKDLEELFYETYNGIRKLILKDKSLTITEYPIKNNSFLCWNVSK